MYDCFLQILTDKRARLLERKQHTGATAKFTLQDARLSEKFNGALWQKIVEISLDDFLYVPDHLIGVKDPQKTTSIAKYCEEFIRLEKKVSSKRS